MTNTTTKVLSANELADQFFLAITSRDWPALAQILTDDATWTFPGNNMLTGTATGIDEIAAKAELIGSYGVQIGFEYVMSGANSFIIKLHNTGRREDLDLDEHLGTVCTTRDGLIASADTHLSDIALMDAYFTPMPSTAERRTLSGRDRGGPERRPERKAVDSVLAQPQSAAAGLTRTCSDEPGP